MENKTMTLKDFQDNYILEVLKNNEGNITLSAKVLGISSRQMFRRVLGMENKTIKLN